MDNTSLYHPSWEHILGKAFNHPVFKDIIKQVTSEQTIPNDKNLWFRAFKVDLTKVKAIIVGHEPQLHNNGLAWGTRTDAPLPNATKIIYTELRRTVYNDQSHFDPTLEKWFFQDVLLLNTSFTSLVNQPMAHNDIWKRFTSNLIKRISEKATIDNPLHWFLWGKHAASFRTSIQNHEVIVNSHVYTVNTPNIVLLSGHPEREFIRKDNSFINNNHFKILQTLIKQI